MTHYAQTNIQLYEQLLEAHWTVADIGNVRASYELAMKIFTAHFRPNHKPFLAHLVGTSSILASHGGDASLVAAGLLHSAYSHGEFGDCSRGMTDAKRRTVRGALGETCESLIARYTEFRWNLQEIEDLANCAERLLPIERNATIVKLADVLEDHLERGMQYSPNKRLPGGNDSEGNWREAIVGLAVALGYKQLSAELRTAFDPAHETPLPEFLFAKRTMSFVMPPISHRIKTTVRLGKLLRRWRRKLIEPIRRAMPGEAT